MEKEKLIKFIKRLNPIRAMPRICLDLRRNAALQYHAVNVRSIGAVSDDAYMADAPRLFPREFAEVERIADQCVQLGEALGKDPNTLQAVELFQSVTALVPRVQPQEATAPVWGKGGI